MYGDFMPTQKLKSKTRIGSKEINNLALKLTRGGHTVSEACRRYVVLVTTNRAAIAGSGIV
jgi:hypothetical protein